MMGKPATHPQHVRGAQRLHLAYAVSHQQGMSVDPYIFAALSDVLVPCSAAMPSPLPAAAPP